MKRMVFEGRNVVKFAVRNIKEGNTSPTTERYNLHKAVVPKINIPLR